MTDHGPPRDYREYRPPRALGGLVECCWTRTLPAATTAGVLPDGCMDLVWTGSELLVAGPDTLPKSVRSDGGLVAAGLRFAPGRLPGLLATPALAVRDQRVPLIELVPSVARRATARIEDGAPPAAVLVDLVHALPGGPAPAEVGAVIRYTRSGRPATEIADALGWTSRTLHRHCLDWFGYGPSVLRRILRFRSALALLRAGRSPAEAAALTGYADQPHLSREVRALSGMSPRLLSGGSPLIASGPGSAG